MITSLEEAQVKGKRILVRVDWNVPLDDAGAVTDDFRIRVALPTIAYLREQGAAHIYLCCHLGNPVIRTGETIERTVAGNMRLRLLPIAKHAAKLLKESDRDLVLEEIPNSPLPGYRLGDDLTLLENLRFDPRELQNSAEFAGELAGLADIFVNEAFPEIHREVASMVKVPKLLPKYAGLRLIDELVYLKKLSDKTETPMVFVLGGAKVHEKIMMIDTLLKKVDTILLGGVMANTFLAAQGFDVGKSVVEKDRLPIAKSLFNRAPQKFVLPLDFVWERDRVLDVGPQTAELYSKYIAKAKILFWNGPLGWTASGRERFFRGSIAVAKAIAASDATSIVAGGDTLDVVHRNHLEKKISFASSGGGSTLAYLAGDRLPGLIALQ